MRDFDYKKSLGQNFLKDNNVINKIASSINPTENDLIVEIGPGAGALTKELIKKNTNLMCFEIDERLKEKLLPLENEKTHIYFGDFLKTNLDDYIDTEKYEHIYFIGNLPYYITTAIINKIVDESDPYEIVIMIQKEVGERFSSRPHSREYGSISVFLQYNFDIETVCKVSRNCFEPVPNVDSIVIKLIKNKKIKANNEIKFYELIRDAFKQKRKNLRNNLKNYDLEIINSELSKFNKDLTARAEEITVDEFVKISNALVDKESVK